MRKHYQIDSENSLWVECEYPDVGYVWVCDNDHGVSTYCLSHHDHSGGRWPTVEWYAGWRWIPLVYTLGLLLDVTTTPEKAVLRALLRYKKTLRQIKNDSNSSEQRHKTVEQLLSELDTKIPELIKQAGF